MSIRVTPQKALRFANLVWAAAYIATIVAVVVMVVNHRNATLRELDTPEARAEWEAWRESPPNQDANGPVKRQPPSTMEPPELMLMRDHFAVVMSGAVLFSSLLFAALMMAARGVFSATTSNNHQQSERE